MAWLCPSKTTHTPMTKLRFRHSRERRHGMELFGQSAIPRPSSHRVASKCSQQSLCSTRGASPISIEDVRASQTRAIADLGLTSWDGIADIRSVSVLYIACGRKHTSVHGRFIMRSDCINVLVGLWYQATQYVMKPSNSTVSKSCAKSNWSSGLVRQSL